jgi:epoxyqueuosine reductase
MNIEKNTILIKQEARRLGFMECGIAKAGFLEEEAPLLEKWLKQGQHGSMQYMERYFDKRLDPRKLVPDARSVISLIYNYFPPYEQPKDAPYKISRYAYGRDYHKVLRKKLKELLHFIRDNIGQVSGRGFVDSAPVMDKAWARHSGNGWLGKHTNILNKNHGSYFFIAELITDLELQYDEPVTDHCGSCTKCIDACPTDAIKPYSVDASKCISYFTIELKDKPIPEKMKGQYDSWVFGCDICQEVCPWNRFSKPHNEPDFGPRDEILNMKKNDWEEITREIFEEKFKGSPVKRAGFEGIKRNLRFVQK